MILLDVLLFALPLAILYHLVRNDLSCRGPCDLFEFDWLEPAFRQDHLRVDLGQA